MSALSDLQDAVTALNTAQANENSAVLSAIAHIQSPSATDAQLVPLTTAIQAAAKAEQANADSLNAAVAAVTTPTPTGTPTTPTPTP